MEQCELQETQDCAWFTDVMCINSAGPRRTQHFNVFIIIRVQVAFSHPCLQQNSPANAYVPMKSRLLLDHSYSSILEVCTGSSSATDTRKFSVVKDIQIDSSSLFLVSTVAIFYQVNLGDVECTCIFTFFYRISSKYGTPSLSDCKMFDFTEVRFYQLLFSSFTTLLHHLLQANKILNVDQHERYYIFM